MIGAMAMGMHGVVRATQDVDMLVRAEKGNIERIRIALRAAYPEDPFVEEIRDDDLLGDYAVAILPAKRRVLLRLYRQTG